MQKHLFTNPKSDGGDATIVRPSNWNEFHADEPLTKGALFDGFDTTDTSDPITGWTTLGSGDISAHDTNSAAKSHYHIKKTVTSGGLVGIYKSWSPSAGKAVSCRISDEVIRNTNNVVGMFIAEASPGKIMTFMQGNYAAVLDRRLLSYDYTNRTTFAAENGAGGLTTGAPYSLPLCLKMIWVSSTEIRLQFSQGGMGWINYFDSPWFDPGFTVGAAGLFVDTNASGTDVEGFFDWFNDE